MAAIEVSSPPSAVSSSAGDEGIVESEDEADREMGMESGTVNWALGCCASNRRFEVEEERGGRRRAMSEICLKGLLNSEAQEVAKSMARAMNTMRKTVIGPLALSRWEFVPSRVRLPAAKAEAHGRTKERKEQTKKEKKKRKRGVVWVPRVPAFFSFLIVFPFLCPRSAPPPPPLSPLLMADGEEACEVQRNAMAERELVGAENYVRGPPSFSKLGTAKQQCAALLSGPPRCAPTLVLVYIPTRHPS